MAKFVLFGESSWDQVVFTSSMGVKPVAYLHNNFFSFTNSKNRRKYHRFIFAVKTFVLVSYNLLFGRKVFFSSINFEVLLVALIFSSFKNCSIFLPNVLGTPSTYSGLFKYVVKSYGNRIIATDEVTLKHIPESSRALKEVFKFRKPVKFDSTLKYIVPLPASHTHTQVSDRADFYYNFSLFIAECLIKRGFQVYLLPHPRDKEFFRASNFNNYSIIGADEISRFGENVCYCSAHSSLSLNRRYGGSYGVWIRLNSQVALHPSLSAKYIDFYDMEC